MKEKHFSLISKTSNIVEKLTLKRSEKKSALSALIVMKNIIVPKATDYMKTFAHITNAISCWHAYC